MPSRKSGLLAVGLNSGGAKMSTCPTCGAGIATDGAEQGEILVCRDCGTELEVLSLDPVRVGLAPPTEEDWGE